MMHSSVAAIMAPILSPSQAPMANACSELAARFSASSGMTTRPAVSVSSSSGYRSLEMASDAGIDMTHDDTSACGLTPSPMYATSTEPAIVANPEHITWCSSALVRWLTNGRISIALSPCPMNGEAAATTASAPDTCMVQKKKTANFWMAHCRMPQ